MTALAQRLFPIVLVSILSAPVQAQEQEAKWFTGQFTSEETGVTTSFVSYGIAETDATAFTAECRSDQQGPGIQVMLIVDYGSHANDTPVDVTFSARGGDATYAGTVFIANSEYAGVQLNIGIDDPLWKTLRRSRRITFGIKDLAQLPVSLRGSSKAISRFLKACRTQFAASDAAAPEGDMLSYTYSCEDGTQLQARFDNSRSYSVAHFSHNGGPEVALIETVSGSGAQYSNGDYTLRTKGVSALLMRGEKVLANCQSN